MATAEEEYKRIYGEGKDDVRVNGDELCAMIAMSNWFDFPKNNVEYRSLNHIAKCYERTSNPSRTLQRLVARMLNDFHVISINKNNRYIFDTEAFDAFVDANPLGKAWWTYLGERATYFRTR